jgi:hypothetical protein
MAEQVDGFDQEYQASDSSEEHALTPVQAVSHLLVFDQRMESLQELIGEKLAQQFFWKAETDTIQTFEHRLSYRYIHVDLETGEFFNQQRESISVERALFHALRYVEPARKPMPLAPVVHEFNLSPFVRLESENKHAMLPATTGPASNLSWSGYFSWVYNGVRGKARALASFARIVSDPVREKEKEALVPFESREITLSAFTRRTA